MIFISNEEACACQRADTCNSEIENTVTFYKNLLQNHRAIDVQIRVMHVLKENDWPNRENTLMTINSS